MGKRQETVDWLTFHGVVLGILAILIITCGVIFGILLALFSLSTTAEADDDPVILSEYEGVVTGVAGDEPVHLVSRNGLTYGLVGNRVVVVNEWTLNHEPETEPSSLVSPYVWEPSEELLDLQSEEEPERP